MSSDSEIERMIKALEDALEGQPTYLSGILALAEVVASKNERLRAFDLCRKALALGAHDAKVVARARRLLSSLVPGYHVGMMNDARRNAAWSKALGDAIRPGTRALEIGTGGGMLALMAARAGAEKVTTCELDPILACIAREIAERNGFGDCIEVVAKPSSELLLGQDIDIPADLLFCDIFGDSLMNFGPLAALEDARRRLTTPDAVVLPAAGAIRLALAEWEGYSVRGHLNQAAGFNLTSFADFVPPTIALWIGDRGLKLKSEGVEALRFQFNALSQPKQGSVEVVLRAEQDGAVNGIVHWIRLELDANTVLEARPERDAVFFSSPRFWPFPQPAWMRGGETLGVGVEYAEKRLTIWPVR